MNQHLGLMANKAAQELPCRVDGALWKEEHTRRLLASLGKAVLKKLQMLNPDAALADLAAPPGNRLQRFLRRQRR